MEDSAIRLRDGVPWTSPRDGSAMGRKVFACYLGSVARLTTTTVDCRLENAGIFGRAANAILVGRY
jgi:hypothetical protein